MKRLAGIAIASTLTFLLTGCHSAGPASVKLGRGQFNQAIQQTNSEQLLMNLVRLRYRDIPYFIEVASVSTSLEVQAEGALSGTFPRRAANSYGAGLGASYSEKPTVTYTPLQGEKFVAQLMSPVQTKTILLLYHSGWSVSRIFRILLQSMNGLPNAPSASGPTPEHVPVYKDFYEASMILRDLQKNGLLEMGLISTKTEDTQQVVTTLELRIDDKAVNRPEVKRLYELLDLHPDKSSFPLKTEVGEEQRDRISIVPRSLMAAFFYLSQAVDPPKDDIRAGRVTVTTSEQGEVFNWHVLTDGLLKIHSSLLPPANAYIAVFYRDQWFYIDDSDLTSKSTMCLLAQLFALQSGDVKSTAPLLTLPVAR
jgi:hypothetical protein